MDADPNTGIQDIAIFKDIQPDDIIQGQLGDCWLLCAMSAMAERPALIERIFDTKEYNEGGVYVIKFCKNGEWQSVTIDDYFPCFPNGGPMFSRGNGNELWVLLIEKAYAKVHGGYKAISGGLPYEGLMDLTGCPTISYNFKDQIV